MRKKRKFSVRVIKKIFGPLTLRWRAQDAPPWVIGIMVYMVDIRLLSSFESKILINNAVFISRWKPINCKVMRENPFRDIARSF